MLAHLDLNTGYVHPIYIPRVPLSGGISILVGFVYEPHGDAALNRCNRVIGVPLIGNAIHDDVDLLHLLIHVDRSAVVEILAAIGGEWKIELGVDREGWILAGERSADIGVVGVVDGVSPEIVVLRLEAVDYRLVVGEINCFVDIV